MSIPNRKVRSVLVGGLMAVGAALSSQVVAALTVEGAAGLDARAQATVQNFRADARAAAVVRGNAWAAETERDIGLPFAEKPLIIAATEGMERRQDRRDDRGDDRGDRGDTRQDCRDNEGVVGKDKRDCKQEDRQERRNGDDDEYR